MSELYQKCLFTSLEGVQVNGLVLRLLEAASVREAKARVVQGDRDRPVKIARQVVHRL